MRAISRLLFSCLTVASSVYATHIGFGQDVIPSLVTFQDLNVGQTTPIWIQGLTLDASRPWVSFITVFQGDGFAITELNGQKVLEDLSDSPDNVLTIAFPVYKAWWLELPFFLFTDDPTDTLTAQAFLGSTLLHTSQASEGHVLIPTTRPYSHIVISSTAQRFAVGDMVAGPIPEPATVALTAIGLAGCVLMARRRTRNS